MENPIEIGHLSREDKLRVMEAIWETYQRRMKKMSRAKRRSVGRDKGQGSEEGRVDFAVGDHQVPVACLALER